MRVRFVTPGEDAPVQGEFPSGENLTIWRAARELGVPLAVPCGGQGLCGRCAVRVDPPPPVAEAEQQLLSPEQVAEGVRLACRCRLERDATVTWAGRPAEERPAKRGAYPDSVPVDPGQSGWGLAFDLGTTTLVAGCVDLASGAVVATGQAGNPQVRFGDDVLARLGHALKGKSGREELRAVAVEGLNRLATEVCAEAGTEPGEVRRAVVVGNPAMHHLLLGWDVDTLARAPHRPLAVQAREVAAGQLGLGLAERATVYLPPLVDGFVGADAVAAALAEGLFTRDPAGRVRLVLDLGTNGELLLAAPQGIYACSTAAGPAFEGGGLRCGMRVAPGAVVGVAPGRPFALEVEGGVRPHGLAGSGALAAAATLLALGALAPNGRLRQAGELPQPAWPGLAERLPAPEGGPQVAILAESAETGGEPVLLTQVDLRQLQLAKGAVRAAVEVLLQRAGVGLAEVAEILLAGAFGQGLTVESALATGLLPPLPAERVRAVGNAAWRGAALLLGAPSLRGGVERGAARIGHLSLAEDPEFPAAYLSALDFPEAG